MTTLEIPPVRVGPDTVTPDVEPPAKPAGRLVGVDIARGLALLGMMTVHVFIVGPDFEGPGETTQTLLEAPSGRAAVLFFILSGVSLSVIAQRGSRSAEPAILRRRGAVLLLGGLVLSAGAWSASILEHYGVMFLLAPLFLVRSNKALLGLAALGMIGGPIALLYSGPISEWVWNLDQGAGTWVISTAWSLLVTGTYPLVVWFGFFAFGVRLGRLDLRQTSTAFGLVAAGVVGVLLVWGAVSGLSAAGVEPATFDDSSFASEGADGDAFAEKEGELIFDSEEEFDAWFEENGDKEFVEWKGDGEFADIERSWSDLASTEPHSGQIAWAAQSSFIAMAILGLALAAPAAAQRGLRPLAALGSISLTAYLVHTVLVTDVWTWATGSDGFDGEPTMSVGGQLWLLMSFYATLLVLGVVITRFFRMGPFERMLKAITQPSVTR